MSCRICGNLNNGILQLFIYSFKSQSMKKLSHVNFRNDADSFVYCFPVSVNSSEKPIPVHQVDQQHYDADQSRILANKSAPQAACNPNAYAITLESKTLVNGNWEWVWSVQNPNPGKWQKWYDTESQSLGNAIGKLC